MSPISHIRTQRRSHASVGKDPALLEIADRIRAARVSAGMTQEELALAAGVGRELVIQLESGKPGVSLGKASRVLGALGMRLTTRAR
jgi:transcriptional regulator with XRE-family HTH domain